MEQQFSLEVLLKLKRKRRRRNWRRVLSVMMCIVVFWTTYALILPAITMETATFCGIEEHIHEEKCYEKALLCQFHVHEEQCFEIQQNLICTISTEPKHRHSEACNPQTQKQLKCALAEGQAHTHTEACGPMTQTTLVCTQAEAPGHTHTEGCSKTETIIICTLAESAEHTHSGGCFTTVTTNICGQAETAGHTHADGCYTSVTTYGCGQTEGAGHTHTDSCYKSVTTYGCGLEEIALHAHGEGCYETVKVPICTIVTDPNHSHVEGCYENKLICQVEEHKHELICYSNPKADLESASTWKATLPKELTGIYRQDVLAVAKSQLGYTESTRNYVVDEDGSTRGYTRYGAWYGNPYGDWCAMFAAFCLHYGGLENYPYHAGCPSWVRMLREKELYREPSEYIPKAGDIIFFDWQQNNSADHVGLVAEVDGTDVITIEGNSGNRVTKNKYEMFDERIAGYGVLVDTGTMQEQYVGPEQTAAWAVLVTPSTGAKTAFSGGQVAPALAGSGEGGLSFGNYSAAAEPLDLSPYINAVNMYDENGNLIPSGSVVAEGDLVEFKIEYTITGQQLAVMNGETITVRSDTLVYKMPSLVEMVESAGGAIVNAAGQEVGTYTIDSTNGTIAMRFSEAYVEQNATGIQIHGFVSCFSTIKKITELDKENQDFQFKDGIVIGVVIEEKNESEGDLTIEKRAASVDGEDIIYEVVVTSAEGTNGSITITDKMSAGLTFVQGIEVRNSNGSLVNNARFNAAADGKSFTMTLPEMAPGGRYTIRYRCAADVSLLGQDMTVRNTATVTGKDSHDVELKDETTAEHTFEMLKKTGVANTDGSITWTITVNQAKVDISGWKLEDIIGGNQAYTGRVTVSDSRGNVLAQNVNLPYTFPSGSTDTYVITYTTTHGYADGDRISNKAILTYGDKPKVEVETGVGIGSPFTKSGEIGNLTQAEDGTNMVPVTWTVTIDTSGGSIPAGKVITDSLTGAHIEADMYMTYDQLMAAIQAVTNALERAGSSVSDYSATVYMPNYSAGQVYGKSALQSNAACKNYRYEAFSVTLGKAIPAGRRISFSYVANGIFTNNIVEESVYKNTVSIANMYRVEASTKFTSGKLKATKTALSYYDPYANNPDWFWDITEWGGSESVSYFEYEKLKDSYLAWSIELSVPPGYVGTSDLTLYENLPDGVAIKGLQLPFQNGVPYDCLRLNDMQPDSTYYWSFKMYPTGQEAENVTIKVVVTKDGDLEITLPSNLLRYMGEVARQNGQKEWYGYLYIFTQIKDDYAWTPRYEGATVYRDRFENRFTIEDEDGEVIDIGSQTQVITKDESDGVIRKEADVDSNNIISYSVVLNAYGRDLIENAGTLAIHDELTYTSTDAQPLRLRLVPGSVKLYEIRMTSGGTYTKLKEVTANYRYDEVSTERGMTTHWTHTIDLNVPDGKALLLEYSYKAEGLKNITHDVVNTCTINGVGESVLEGDSKLEIEVKDAMAQADTKGIMLYKVDANSDGVFLENAQFHIYIWNDELEKYIIVHHPNNGSDIFTTDRNGMIVLDSSTVETEQFAYNTAYYIVEIESPDGYYLGPEPYYFYIKHDETTLYPWCGPPGFEGVGLISGDIIYRQNVSETTEISIEKYWKGYNGESITVTGEKIPTVKVELWQRLRGDPNSAKLFGTYTVTPDEDGNWNYTITGLPRATRNPDGTRGTDYLYYIKEVKVAGYGLESTENNEGINEGIIKLVNRKEEGYDLPKTGGAGTQLYTTAGLLLMLTSTAFLVYINKKRRREDTDTS